MGNIPGQIIGELSEIGKSVGGQTAQATKDIAGKALESFGLSGGNKSGSKPFVRPTAAPEGGKPQTVWEQIDVEKDAQARRSMARRALEEFMSGGTRRPKEPSIWERLQMETDEKKKQETLSRQASAKTQLSVPESVRKRGDLHGINAKQTATENRNVRQD
jgi:hypothetical protein